MTKYWKSPSSFTMGLILTCLGLNFCGCGTVEDPTLDFVGSELSISRIDDLSRVIQFSNKESQSDQREFINNVRSGLNRWITYSQDRIKQADWKLDPLFQQAADQQNEGAAVLKETDQLNFIDTDGHFLQETIWLTQIIGRLSKLSPRTYELYRLAADNFEFPASSDYPIADLMQRLHPDLDSRQSKDLARAFQWFDWVTVNVQLLPETRIDESLIADARLNQRESLPAAGVHGTGYQRFPWQSLMLGRGDYLDRAKLFLRGLDMMKLDAVILADAGTDQSSTERQSQPWAVGVLIGGQIFLFDTRLGLPIPGSRPGSIATLSELRSQPELLDQLDLTVSETLEENSRYWMKGDRLRELEGLVYVAPESASLRFAALEANLTEEEPYPFAVSPSRLAERFSAVDGLTVKVWPIAIQTHQFRQAVREALEDRTNIELRERLAWYFTNEYYIDEFPRYRTSRVRFFRGKYETKRDVIPLTAIESFESLLYPDETIDNLAADSMLHERLGVTSDINKDSAEFNRRISSIQAHMRLVRRDCNIFMAQCHFDNGSFTAVKNWLDITRSNPQSVRWEEAVIYLGGRAQESMKDYDAAIKEYRRHPQAVQAHGNLIRARLLQSAIEANFGQVNAASEFEPAPDESAEATESDQSASDQATGESSDSNQSDKSDPAKPDPAKPDPARSDSANS
jgi:hypothetical protein